MKLTDFLEQRELQSFTDLIIQNLRILEVNSGIDLISPIKDQIDFMLRKLQEFPRLTSPANVSITRVKKLRQLISRAQTQIKHISCLACLYWLDGRNEILASTAETLVFYLINIMPYGSGVVSSYLEDSMIPQFLASYLDFLLKDLFLLSKDDMELLREDLIFLSSFLIDPPMENSEVKEMILGQVYAIINSLPSFIRSIHIYRSDEDFSKSCFSSFMQNINRVRGKVTKLYASTLHSSEVLFPMTNQVGFLDSLIRMQKNMLKEDSKILPSTKNQINMLCEELTLLRLVLQCKIGLQNEVGGLKDLWTQAIGVVYRALYVTHFIVAKSFSIWYGIASIPIVIEDVKFTRAKLQNIIGAHETCSFYRDTEVSALPPPLVVTSQFEGALIGFKEESMLIVDQLIGGRDVLTIISISGMPGQGKTTLAKHIYNDVKIQRRFRKIVWCYVSKECKARELLIKVGCHLIGKDVVDEKFEDLADDIRKCLKQQRYLIVMDDIWDVKIWSEVQRSFPDDKKGSRIMFTSRNQGLASQVKQNCISHPLRLFSDKESWDLMKEKLFSSDSGYPQDVTKIAKRISKCCKGLPLAVALISSLLGRMKRQLDLWEEVAKNIKSHLASEGCQNVIELSYKFLPEHLKSCFLYFGAFPRGEDICTSTLKSLWIAEGFIKDDDMQCTEDLAKEYLDNLVSASIVNITKRNSMGGIKKCNVHDLLYDFSIEKNRTENFLNWMEEIFVMDRSSISPQKYLCHRISICDAYSFIEPKPICTRNELPTGQVNSFLFLGGSVGKYVPWFNIRILNGFRALTVLNMERVVMTRDQFLEIFLYNIHLRYIAVSSDDHVHIPASIANM